MTLRILLVDDNLDHAQLALRALKHADWKVDTARLGEEALDHLQEAAYDLVLLDYRLPDLSGLEVLKRIRQKGQTPAVIMMTSQGSEEVAIEALNSGAFTYVVKNADLGKRLAYEIQEWLASKEG